MPDEILWLYTCYHVLSIFRNIQQIKRFIWNPLKFMFYNEKEEWWFYFWRRVFISPGYCSLDINEIIVMRIFSRLFQPPECFTNSFIHKHNRWAFFVCSSISQKQKYKKVKDVCWKLYMVFIQKVSTIFKIFCFETKAWF